MVYTLRQIAMASALMLSCSAGAAQAAQPFIYDCEMTGAKQGKGWISPQLALVFPGDDTVQVVDAVILHFNKGPIAATVLRDNAKRLVVKWTIKDARSDQGRSFANFDYRASLAKATGKIELTAVPREFDSGLRSAGTCSKRSN